MNSIDLLNEEKNRVFDIAKKNKKDFLNSDWKDRKESFFSPFEKEEYISEFSFDTMSDFSNKLKSTMNLEELPEEIYKVCTMTYFKSKNGIANKMNDKDSIVMSDGKNNKAEQLPDFVYVF